MHLVVAYDIPDDRRRRALEKVLGSYGVRANYSVFEVELDTRAQWSALRRELEEKIDAGEDNVRIYPIDRVSVAKAVVLGVGREPFARESGHVF